MNSLTKLNVQPLTMSSREIAELTGKEHRNVMRDIRAMLVALYGEKGVLNFEHTHTNHQNGQSYSVFNLPKNLTITLIASYNIKLRKRIIDHWTELEEQAAKVNALNPSSLSRLDILKLALEAEQARIELQSEVEVLKPKANALDRIATADGSVCPTDAAKNLNVQRKALLLWLQKHKWLYRRMGCSHYCGYQDKIQAGLIEQKVTVVKRSDGTEKIMEQARITASGLVRLSKVPNLRIVA